MDEFFADCNRCVWQTAGGRRYTPGTHRQRCGAPAAVAICQGCPFREPCLEVALAEPERFGTWGGTTAAERRQVLAERGIVFRRRGLEAA